MKKIGHRRFVPLRVPVRTLTKIEGCKNYHQGLWTPRCHLRSLILVSPKGEFQNSANLLFPSSLHGGNGELQVLLRHRCHCLM